MKKNEEIKTAIEFYSDSGDYGCFSNFSRHFVNYCGDKFKTSEHAFQAQKFVNTKYFNKVKNASNPMEAASIGRNRKNPLRKDWESVKIQIMEEVVYSKFVQNESIQKTLLDTGTSKIVEHTSNDNFWADGGDGSGRNELGKILMKVRDRIKKELKGTLK